MFDYHKIGICCIRSRNIMDLYEEIDDYILRETIDSEDAVKLINKLKKNCQKENDCYKNLSKNNIISFKFELDNLPSTDSNISAYISRINNKLNISYDKICNNSIKNGTLFESIDSNMDLSITDLIYSKIAIDSQKLVYNKIKGLTTDNYELENYIYLLTKLDQIYTISYLSINEISEKLLIENLFDIEKIPTYLLKDIETRIYNDKGINVDLTNTYNNLFMSLAINILEELNNIKLNPNNISSIYTNLCYTSKFEIILDYLTKDELLKLLTYCNELNISKILKYDITNSINKKILKK